MSSLTHFVLLPSAFASLASLPLPFSFLAATGTTVLSSRLFHLLILSLLFSLTPLSLFSSASPPSCVLMIPESCCSAQLSSLSSLYLPQSSPSCLLYRSKTQTKEMCCSKLSAGGTTNHHIHGSCCSGEKPKW